MSSEEAAFYWRPYEMGPKIMVSVRFDGTPDLFTRYWTTADKIMSHLEDLIILNNNYYPHQRVAIKDRQNITVELLQ
jgi:hypothetical protein